MLPLKNKQIVLGITGSIAIYRACDLVRYLRAMGAKVAVVMSETAAGMINPSVFEALTGQPVGVKFDDPRWSYAHLDYARRFDLMVVAPATANFLAKAAHGIADDLITTAALAFQPSRLVVAPAMNPRMMSNPATVRNLRQLAEDGAHVVGVEEGELACGEVGEGRLAPVAEITDHVARYFTKPSLLDQHVVVTAGPTREAIDPVRFLSNRSSGKLGYAIAAEAWRRGAHVTLVSGPTEQRVPTGVEVIEIETAEQLNQQVEALQAKADVLVSAAAVSDFRPAEVSASKLKKGKTKTSTLKLVANPDTLAEAGKRKTQGQLLVGFALESEAMLDEAERKLKAKQLDLIVANDPSTLGADDARLTLLDAQGVVEDLLPHTKPELASKLWDKIEALAQSSKEKR